MHTHKAKGSEAVEYYGKMIVGDSFLIDDPHHPRRKEIYQDLYFYFAGSSKTTLALDRGILITGSLGVGKSILFKVMNQLFHAFKYVHAKRDIERDLKDRALGEVEVMRMYGYDYKGNLMIDDVGTEEPEIYLYKNSIPILGQILLERYDLYQDQGLKTHITTNLKTNALEDIYGQRNFDRFKEMFNVISWSGSSLRK